MSLENDLMIYENDIEIDNKGAGKQIFVKTDFALEIWPLKYIWTPHYNAAQKAALSLHLLTFLSLFP